MGRHLRNLANSKGRGRALGRRWERERGLEFARDEILFEDVGLNK